MIAPIYYKRHGLAPAIIAYAVWLYFRFSLSQWILEDLFADRGIIVSHQTIKTWAEIAKQDSDGDPPTCGAAFKTSRAAN